MNAQQAMKTVYDVIKAAKDMSAEGTDVIISPKDFKGKLTGTELWRTVQKMEKDYNLFISVIKPDPILAHQYDDINDLLKPTYEHKHKYLLHPNENFEEFPSKILKENLSFKELPEYIPYYMQLMFQAINELGVSEENQPAKKEIEGWFNDNYPELSGNDVKALSTFVRHPDKKQGGWHTNKRKINN